MYDHKFSVGDIFLVSNADDILVFCHFFLKNITKSTLYHRICFFQMLNICMANWVWNSKSQKLILLKGLWFCTSIDIQWKVQQTNNSISVCLKKAKTKSNIYSWFLLKSWCFCISFDIQWKVQQTIDFFSVCLLRIKV